jgi:hypothetical protein
MTTFPVLTQRSLADISEGELVVSMLSEPRWRQLLVGLHGIPDNVRHYPEVQLATLGKKGDIDILLVAPGRPEFATAIQVKRVKVAAATFANGKSNKLDALEELKRQTNLLVDLGFAQVFCFVIVVVDSRIQSGGLYRFDGLTPELRRTIEGSLSTEGLAKRIGLVHYQIVQPMDDVPLNMGTFSAKSLRMPEVAAQPQLITTWVAQVVEQRDA